MLLDRTRFVGDRKGVRPLLLKSSTIILSILTVSALIAFRPAIKNGHFLAPQNDLKSVSGRAIDPDVHRVGVDSWNGTRTEYNAETKRVENRDEIDKTAEDSIAHNFLESDDQPEAVIERHAYLVHTPSQSGEQSESVVQRPAPIVGSDSLSRAQSVALVSLHGEAPWNRDKNISDRLILSKLWYCSIHGYTYLSDPEMELGASDLLPWQKWMRGEEGRYRKLRALHYFMDRPQLSTAEWFLWIDGDVIIADNSIRAENRVRELLDLYQRTSQNTVDQLLSIVGSDGNGLNNGVWFLRNNAEMKIILERIWKTPVFTQKSWADQKALITYMGENTKFRSRIFVVPLLQTNRLIQSGMYDPSKYKPGDWLVHMVDCTRRNRFKLITLFDDQILASGASLDNLQQQFRQYLIPEATMPPNHPRPRDYIGCD